MYRTGGSFLHGFMEKFFKIKLSRAHAEISGIASGTLTNKCKIGTLRDPWTWFLSIHKHHFADYNTNHQGALRTLEEYILNIYENEPDRSFGSVFSMFFFSKRLFFDYQNITNADIDNLFLMDCMIDFDNLNLSFCKNMNRLGIDVTLEDLKKYDQSNNFTCPSSGQPKMKWNLQDFYSEDLYNLVREKEKPFIRYFNIKDKI